jgi:hypothetical protein
MRTTIDLPDDLHELLRGVARDRRETLSQAASTLLRNALMPGASKTIESDPRTGLPVVRIGRTVTADDVRNLEDE